MFTADPVSGSRDLTVIAATYGLGEGIVSGSCDGDTYAVNQSGEVVRRDIVEKVQCIEYDARTGEVGLVPVPESRRGAQACQDAVLVRLAAIGGEIESELGQPQDIEWCLDGERIYILQTRPITSLGSGDHPVRIWDNANIIESYPGITLPLTFSFIEPVYAEIYARLFRLFGLSQSYLARHGAAFNMLGYFRGRVYYNLLSWYRNLALLPGGERHLRHFDEMLGTGSDLDPIDLPQARPAGSVRTTWIILRLVGRFLIQPWSIRRFMKRVTAEREAADAKDFRALRLDELVALFQRQESLLLRHWTTPQFNDFYCQTASGWLKSAISHWLGEDSTVAMHELLPVDESVESERAVNSLCDLAAAIRKTPRLADACQAPSPRGCSSCSAPTRQSARAWTST